MRIFDFFFKRIKRSEQKATCREPQLKAFTSTIETTIMPSSLFDLPTSMGNDKYQQIRKAEIEYLENRYDFNTLDGIASISKENINDPSTKSVTGRLESYLMKKAGRYELTGEVDMALACYRKAIELMPLSPLSYTKEPYMRLPRYLRKLRRFDEANMEESKIEKLFLTNTGLSKPHDLKYQEMIAIQLQLAIREGCNLVEVTSVSGCCETCGKYRGRIFRILEKDKRFPKFPNDFCNKCGLTIFPFFFDISRSMYSKKENALFIAKMNRPFIDTRTKKDLLNYQIVLERIAQEEAREQNRIDYNWLFEHIPELCPKSLSGYSRMKNLNSDKYQNLVSRAKEMNYVIE